MAAAENSGCAEKGTFVYMKHFALNDKEDRRNGISTWANEQAIREIYLKPFEIAVKEAKADILYYDDENAFQSRQKLLILGDIVAGLIVIVGAVQITRKRRAKVSAAK